MLKWSDIAGQTELLWTDPSREGLWEDGDPVHLTESGYRLVAAAINAELSDGTNEGGPRKRPRLESVVPTPNTFQRGKPVPLPTWVYCVNLQAHATALKATVIHKTV